MRNSFKILIFVLCLIMFSVFASGCAAAVLARPTPLPGVATFSVTGSCNISINNNVITVSGQTDLMDGVFLHVSVVAQDGMTMDSVIITKSGNQVSQNFYITDKYKDVTSVAGFITCAPQLYGKQPDNVYKNYGEKFEYIVADQKDYQWDKNGIIIIFESDMVNLQK